MSFQNFQKIFRNKSVGEAKKIEIVLEGIFYHQIPYVYWNLLKKSFSQKISLLLLLDRV